MAVDPRRCRHRRRRWWRRFQLLFRFCLQVLFSRTPTPPPPPLPVDWVSVCSTRMQSRRYAYRTTTASISCNRQSDPSWHCLRHARLLSRASPIKRWKSTMTNRARCSRTAKLSLSSTCPLSRKHLQSVLAIVSSEDFFWEEGYMHERKKKRDTRYI